MPMYPKLIETGVNEHKHSGNLETIIISDLKLLYELSSGAYQKHGNRLISSIGLVKPLISRQPVICLRPLQVAVCAGSAI